MSDVCHVKGVKMGLGISDPHFLDEVALEFDLGTLRTFFILSAGLYWKCFYTFTESFVVFVADFCKWRIAHVDTDRTTAYVVSSRFPRHFSTSIPTSSLVFVGTILSWNRRNPSWDDGSLNLTDSCWVCRTDCGWVSVWVKQFVWFIYGCRFFGIPNSVFTVIVGLDNKKSASAGSGATINIQIW